MIDVHPPEHAAHTWEDFFIHIATIVIGLLIAIGLEQSVEWVHHRHELADARQQLATEYQVNLVRYRTERTDFQRFVPILRRDLVVLEYLRAHPGAPPSSWPSQISWARVITAYTDSSWKSLQGSPVLALFPRKELERDTNLYSRLSVLDAEDDEASSEIGRADKYVVRGQTPSEMTPAQLDDAIEGTTDALNTFRRMYQTQSNLHSYFPEFAPAPTTDDVLRDFDIKNIQLMRSDQDAQSVNAELRARDEDIKRIEEQDNKE